MKDFGCKILNYKKLMTTIEVLATIVDATIFRLLSFFILQLFDVIVSFFLICENLFRCFMVVQL